ncbi:hypothetical protein HCJ39_13290 [Listeria rocourtiae]|uniref:hypothetical protein n=1 Tax=Listeria rocourtiae TaxID=647910 RepID=UPI001629D704|nr:hypothetical protein [Listeria rocourtiae]MBC1605689.1 hypothetical protein [Listeria rocourtiae]
MSKIMYKETRFKPENLALIEKVNLIIDDFLEKGYELTLRQVYYQLVASDVIENKERSYKNLGTLVSNARLSGLIDWHAIVDRTRFLRGRNYDYSPDDSIDALANAYKTNPWVGQPNHVEVWVEKDALVDIVGQISNKLDVRYFSCRGYVSQSAMWQAARRLANATMQGKDVTILHLGDHDPSGQDMSRDIEERLNTFEVYPDVKRIALNMDQIELYSPPPNPTKLTDSRAGEYIKRFGYESWELDALRPEAIEALIRSHVEPLIDTELMNEVKADCEKEKTLLRAVAENWDVITEAYGGEK